VNRRIYDGQTEVVICLDDADTDKDGGDAIVSRMAAFRSGAGRVSADNDNNAFY